MLVAAPINASNVEEGEPRNQETSPTYTVFRRKASDPLRIFCRKPCLGVWKR